MEEKRKFPRLNINKIKVLWRKEGALDNLDDIKNISGGGVCLMMDKREAEVGCILQLEFKLPEGKIIHLKGRVAWIAKLKKNTQGEKESYEVGVEFIDMYDSDREQIKQFVDAFYPPDERKKKES